MGRPIPEDEQAEPAQLEAAEAAEPEVENEESPDGGEPLTEATESEYSIEDLEAAAGDDKQGMVPQWRVNEIVAERKAAEEEARKLREQLAVKAEPEKPAVKVRDFDAELKALKDQYKAGDLDMDEYLEKREEVTDARAEAKVEARVKPVAEKLEQEHSRILTERLASELAKEATKWFGKYPFLDVDNKATKNDEAIGKVIAERDELIRAGIAPVKALRLAVQSIAPDYVTEEAEPVTPADEVAQRRAQAARKAALDANNRQPPNIAKSGAGTKDTGGKTRLNARSVEDAERYERMTPEQKKNVEFA